MEEMKKREYYYCPRCNKAVSIKLKKCDTPECDKKFTSGKERPYTWDEVQEKIKVASKKSTAVKETDDGKQEELTMVCPVCDKRYGRSVSKCADCGAYVVYGNFEDSSTSESPNALQESSTDKMEKLQSDVAMSGDYRWKLIVRRFYNQLERDSRELYVDSEMFSLGRGAILDANLFGYDKKSVHNTINNVSEHNALLINRDGKLYVRIDDINVQRKSANEKAPVYIDGKKLPVGVEYPVASGQKLLMGNGALTNLNGCVEYEVVELEKEKHVAGVEGSKLEGMIEKILEMQEETVIRVRDTSNKVEEFTGIQLNNYESFKAYIAEQMQKLNKRKTDEEYIEDFLEGYVNKDEFLSHLTEAQADCILNAARAEGLNRQSEIEDIHYGSAFIFVCHLIEAFCRQRIGKFMEKYNQKYWNNLTEGKDHLEIGTYTKAYKSDCKATRTMFEDIAKDINRHITDKSQKLEGSDVKEQFMKIEHCREYRNRTAHVNMDAALNARTVNIDYEEYSKAKELVFKDSFIITITDYYRMIFGEE